jgi:hypothetical protein
MPVVIVTGNTLVMWFAGVRYLSNLGHASTLIYNTWPVNSLSISPNGSLLVSKYYIPSSGDAQ